MAESQRANVSYRGISTVFAIDFEFFQSSGCLIPISIGIKASTGAELYLQSCAFDPNTPDAWVKTNVYPFLAQCDKGQSDPHLDTIAPSRGIRYQELRFTHLRQCSSKQCPWRDHLEMQREVEWFIREHSQGHPPVFVGENPAYDFVLLCQLLGMFEDWPKEWPFGIYDIEQLAYDIDYTGPLPEQKEPQHHALNDARHIIECWEFLEAEKTARWFS